MRPPRRPRLKRTIEILAAQNGDLHLHRGGDQDFVVKGAGERGRALLESLDGTRSLDEVCAALAAQGLELSADDVRASVVELAALGLVEDAAEDARLTSWERERYDRQLRYFSDCAPPGVAGAEYQQRLGRASVTVLGVGGLGGAVALALAASGLGRLTLVDGDHIELSNLNRQVLFTESDLGRPKVAAAAARLRAFNSGLELATAETTLGSPEDVVPAIAGADLVVDAVDTPAHLIERWVNEACFGAGVPYIAMSQYPPRVRLGPLFVPGQTGCYACQEVAWRRRYPLYDELARSRGTTSSAAALATTSLLVGAQIASEVVHYLTGLACPVTLGRSFVLDVTTMEMESEPIVQIEGCCVCARAPVSAEALA